jgi:serine/threonine protein kinase
VKKAVHKATDQPFACKIIDKALVGEKTEMITTEIEILRKVRHPSVIWLKEVFETQSQIYLIMEL